MPADSLTRSQAAAALGVTVKTLYTWEKNGRIPPPARDWRGWRRYTPAQVEAIRGYQAARHGPGPPGASTTPPGGELPSPGSPPRPADQPPPQVSARNRLVGTVISIRGDGVLAEVVLDLGGGQEVVAVITQSSVDRLGLRVGVEAAALIKATEVLIAR